jgi:hypothetical protein
MEPSPNVKSSTVLLKLKTLGELMLVNLVTHNFIVKTFSNHVLNVKMLGLVLKSLKSLKLCSLN